MSDNTNEPTEWGSIVRARRSPGAPLTLLTYVPEPDEVRDSRYSWYSDQDSWHIWSDLSDVERLRVGVGGQYSPSLQQLRDLLFRSPSGYLTNEETLAAYTGLRKGISDLLSGNDAAAEPTPEQVEAAAAPAEYVAIEALVVEVAARAVATLTTGAVVSVRITETRK